MAKYCSHCGSELDEGGKFCPKCGQEQPGAEKEQQAAGTGAVRTGIPAPGFSDRVNHPEILAAVKKNRKAAGVFAFFLVPIPLIGFLIYSAASQAITISQALLYGGIVSVVFLVFALYGFVKSRPQNSYEAVVEDKGTHMVTRNRNSEQPERITEYVTTVRTTDGKTKKIREQEGSPILAYNYLEKGEKFKFHPQFNFPYEKYDKSRAPYLACVSCGRQNPVEADRCEKCGVPLLK